MEDRTDALIEKLTKKKTEKVTKKIKSVDGSNSFLIGLKGDGVAKYDREIGKLFAESDDVAANRLGKMNTVGFCAPCSIQKEVRAGAIIVGDLSLSHLFSLFNIFFLLLNFK